MRAHCTRGHITRQEKSEKSEQCGFQAELCEEAVLPLEGKDIMDLIDGGGEAGELARWDIAMNFVEKANPEA